MKFFNLFIGKIHHIGGTAVKAFKEQIVINNMQIIKIAGA